MAADRRAFFTPAFASNLTPEFPLRSPALGTRLPSHTAFVVTVSFFFSFSFFLHFPNAAKAFSPISTRHFCRKGIARRMKSKGTATPRVSVTITIVCSVPPAEHSSG